VPNLECLTAQLRKCPICIPDERWTLGDAIPFRSFPNSWRSMIRQKGRRKLTSGQITVAVAKFFMPPAANLGPLCERHLLRRKASSWDTAGTFHRSNVRAPEQDGFRNSAPVATPLQFADISPEKQFVDEALSLSVNHCRTANGMPSEF
jgi:hypothetical protein